MARRYRFRRARREGSLGVWAWAMLACALVVAGLWTVGLVRFVDSLPRERATAVRTADAVVVLTGGSKRLDEGFALLSAKAAPALFISGVDERVDERGLTALLDPDTPEPSPEMIDCCLDLGHGASDTIGNARETEIWMRVGDRASLLLVTSNYHMPRARLEFAHAMPGIEVIPHPVIPPDVRLNDWYRYPGTLALLANEYTKYLFAHARVTVADWFMALAT
jgi:uncharacterized SAM-binding protein YcdF (DUF218 family)